MDSNKITNIEFGAFGGFIKLGNLILTTINDYLFKDLKCLQKLRLDLHRILSINVDTFDGLKSLRVLDLSFDRIKSLNRSFQKMTKLEYILVVWYILV